MIEIPCMVDCYFRDDMPTKLLKYPIILKMCQLKLIYQKESDSYNLHKNKILNHLNYLNLVVNIAKFRITLHSWVTSRFEWEIRLWQNFRSLESMINQPVTKLTRIRHVTNLTRIWHALIWSSQTDARISNTVLYLGLLFLIFNY